VADFLGAAVSVVSDSNDSVVATVDVGTDPTGVAYDPADGEVFVTNAANGTLSVISDASDSVVATVKAGSSPSGVDYDSGKGEVFAANNGDDTVSVVSPPSVSTSSSTVPEFPGAALAAVTLAAVSSVAVASSFLSRKK
jgi:YVTN family beta-propeller protein